MVSFVTLNPRYVNMADINFSNPSPDPDSRSAEARSPAARSGDLRWDIIELLFFAYRDFVGDADHELEAFGFGRAHHRVLHFVHRYPGLKVADLLDVLRITKQSLGRVLKQLLDEDYIELGEGHVVLPDDSRAYGRPIESLPRDEQEMLLPRALMVALNRFGATRSVQDAAEAVRAECENELDRLDAQLSMVRFTAWAIPAVGFVGTVRGIGRALQEAQGAIHGDISGVTLGLGVTFNATLTALVSCILVMFFLHQLQQAQDRLVLDARMYIDRRLIRNMRVH